jgi:hypothetical protein
LMKIKNKLKLVMATEVVLETESMDNDIQLFLKNEWSLF